jgi:hypothetical protein
MARVERDVQVEVEQQQLSRGGGVRVGGLVEMRSSGELWVRAFPSGRCGKVKRRRASELSTFYLRFDGLRK